MNKLSKEQADWLIEKIMNKVRTGEFADVVYADEIEDAIKECTEKEFPQQTINLHTYDQVIAGCIKLSSFVENDIEQVELRMHTPGKQDSYTTLFKDEFFEFTQGCREIVKWLEEQKR